LEGTECADNWHPPGTVVEGDPGENPRFGPVAAQNAAGTAHKTPGAGALFAAASCRFFVSFSPQINNAFVHLQIDVIDLPRATERPRPEPYPAAGQRFLDENPFALLTLRPQALSFIGLVVLQKMQTGHSTDTFYRVPFGQGSNRNGPLASCLLPWGQTRFLWIPALSPTQSCSPQGRSRSAGRARTLLSCQRTWRGAAPFPQ
jgi:hypothetical protein